MPLVLYSHATWSHTGDISENFGPNIFATSYLVVTKLLSHCQYLSWLLSDTVTRAVRRQKKSRQKRRLVQAPQAPFKAPIHSRCCIGGFRETGLALVIVLRCDWPLCDIWFKSYEHFKIKMFLGEASYRPRTGLVQVPFTGAWKKGGASGAFFHLGALRCQQL